MKETLLKVVELPDKDLLPEKVELDVAFKKKIGGELTRKDFLGLLYEWSYKYVLKKGHYNHRELPPKPMSLFNFEAMPYERRERLSKEARDKIQDFKLRWLDEVSKCELENNSDRDWLFKMKSYFEHKADTLKVIEIKQKIKEYERG